MIWKTLSRASVFRAGETEELPKQFSTSIKTHVLTFSKLEQAFNKLAAGMLSIEFVYNLPHYNMFRPLK